VATTAANTAIKNRLAAVDSFRPATVNLFDGWLLDPGDVVTVQSGEDSYRVPVYRMDTTWKGNSRTEIQSTGSEKRPPLSALKRRSYAGGRAQAETEKELIRHDADIERSKERILLWATEEEWDDIEEQWQLTHKSEIEVINNAINERVTQNSLNQTLQGYLTIQASRAELGVLLREGDTAVTSASLYAAINQDNTSTGGINADKVILSSSGGTTVTLNDKVEVLGDMSISNGSLYINGNVYAGLQGDKYIQATSLKLVGSSGSQYANVATLTYDDVDEMIVKAAVSGNTLQLWKKGDASSSPSITFSKATTLSGVWGSGASGPTGVYTVTASPQGATNTTSLSPTGHWGNTADGETATTYYGVMKATINGGATLYDARNYEISAASKLTTQTITPTSSQQTVTPPTGYIGFSSVTVEAGGGGSSSVNDISLLDTITWYDSTAPTPSGTSLTSLASMIQAHKNDRGYIRFSAKLNGVSGTKWYKVAIG